MAYNNCGNTYKIYCQSRGPCCRSFCLAVRCGRVVLALPNSCDSTQLWRKEYTNCGFMLVNNCSNMCIKYCSAGVQLEMVCKPNCGGNSVTWTECGDRTCSYGYLRTLSCNMVMDAWTGNISDGLPVSIYTPYGTENQHWKLERCYSHKYRAPPFAFGCYRRSGVNSTTRLFGPWHEIENKAVG